MRAVVVIVLAFYSDDPSSNPTEVYSFSVKLLLKRTKSNKKRPGVGPFIKRLNNDSLPNFGIFHFYSFSVKRSNLFHSSRILTRRRRKSFQGLVDKEGGSQSEGCEFESLHRYWMDIFTVICCKICIVFEKTESK